MKNEMFKGTMILVISGIIVKILGALYRIPLSNILGAEGIGLYQMIFPIFSLALIISSSGVSSTVSLLVAKARAKKCKNIKIIFWKGFLYSFVLSLFFSILFFFFAERIAILQGNINAIIGYKIMIISLIFASLLSSFRGYFQGHSNMIPTATSQTIEQFFKVILGLLFAIFFVKKSVALGVAGAFLGIGISEIIAFVYLWLRFLFFEKSQTSKQKNIHSNNKSASKITPPSRTSNKDIDFLKSISFFKINLSITISFFVIPLILTFDSFVVINLLNFNFSKSISTALYGLQSGLVNSLINFPVIISTALSLSILPTLSFLISKKKIEKLKEKLKDIFKTIWIISLPCIIFFIMFSNLVMKVLYGAISPQFLHIASTLLKISAIEILFISILQVSIAIFQSFGKEKTPIYILLFSGIIKIFLTIILVQSQAINIYGVAVANLVFYAISSTLSLFLIKRKFKFNLEIKLFIISLLSILIMSLCFYIINVFILDIWTKLSLIVAVTIIFYILPLFLFGIIDFEKLITKNLKHLKKRKN